MATEIIHSVGIDVGTSTTKLVFSELTIENLASSLSVPRLQIVKKSTVYRSDIYPTPLLDPRTVDGEALRTIIAAEYRKAGMHPEDIRTGAVIITGETARTDNAEEVLNALSTFAGDFVVATAGPDLEAIMAGRGAGADQLSLHLHTTVANVDVGGGTSNIALFHDGDLVGTTCLDLGGRLVRIDQGRIVHVHPVLQRLATEIGLRITVGETADPTTLLALTRGMVRHLAQALNLVVRDHLHESLYTGGCSPMPTSQIPAFTTFSGGVADYVDLSEVQGVFPHGDIGALLGRAIREDTAFDLASRGTATETIRATVVGAGTHTTEVSGSTIDYHAESLPIRNLPIVKVPATAEQDLDSLPGVIAGLVEIYQKSDVGSLAIALTGNWARGFTQVVDLTQAILRGAKAVVDSPHVLVLLFERDIAKVIGQTIAMNRGKRKDIICIDGIQTTTGDYIDIGSPVGDGQAVPVVVKTLVFNS